MKRTLIFLFVVTGMILTGCSPKVPYTSALAQKYKLTENDLKKVQFYTSEDIILNIVESSSKTGTEDGAIVVNSNTSQNQVLIKKGTPGVLLKQVGSDKISIAFETGDDKYLVFGSTSPQGVYKLQAENWDNGSGKLSYGGKTYYASPASGSTYVVVSLKKFQRNKSNQTVVEGRKVQ